MHANPIDDIRKGFGLFWFAAFFFPFCFLAVIGCSRSEHPEGRRIDSVETSSAQEIREPSFTISQKGDCGVAEICYWIDKEIPSQIQMAIDEFRNVRRLRHDLKEEASGPQTESSQTARDELLAWIQADKTAEFRGARVWKDSRGYFHLIGLGEMSIDADEKDRTIWKRYRDFADQKACRSCEMLAAGEFAVKTDDQPDGKVVQTVMWKRGRLVAEEWCTCEKQESNGIIRLISAAHAIPAKDSRRWK